MTSNLDNSLLLIMITLSIVVAPLFVKIIFYKKGGISIGSLQELTKS
ncbi:MAG: hypothetical protein K1000chlam2_01255 [Chlamydiae bacterium]|nr:hypothetical protein [Chlamydiota bacterium]